MMLYLDVMMQLLWRIRREENTSQLNCFTSINILNMYNRKQQTLLRHTETFRCTLCHWL